MKRAAEPVEPEKKPREASEAETAETVPAEAAPAEAATGETANGETAHGDWAAWTTGSAELKGFRELAPAIRSAGNLLPVVDDPACSDASVRKLRTTPRSPESDTRR